MTIDNQGPNVKEYNSWESLTDHEVSQGVNELADIKYALDESSIVAVTDQHGVIKYVNEKFCEVSQYTREELIGKTHRIINSGHHSKEFMRQLWETIQIGEVWKGQIKNKAKDGSYYWVDTTIVPFLDKKGEPYQYLALRTEVTEYKRIKDELRNSMNELYDFKFALDESSIVAITDRRGTITYVNDKFCEISKYNREELIGRDHNILNSGFHPKDFFRSLWKTIGSGEVWKGEIKNKAKDGSYYWVDTTIVPFLDDDRKPYQYLAIRNEITERKRVEQELQQMMTRLLHVQEEERKKVSRELHDGIGQSLYSLLITINRLGTETDHPLMEQLQSSVTELIEDIRGISWELRPSLLDDLGLMPALRSFFNRYSQHYGIKVEFKSEISQRYDVLIETTIYRIVQEALTNVRKYAEVSEVFVTILKKEKKIQVFVRDEGKGYDPNLSPKGVGLFSMEERAKAINGQLTINAKPGEGTEVILSIPISEQEHHS